MEKVLIVGAGGHGRSVAEAILAMEQYEVAGFVDDVASGLGETWDFPVLGNTVVLSHYRAYAEAAVIAIGNNTVREKLYYRLYAAGFKMITVIHPQASVSPRALIGEGSTIMAGAIIGTQANLGKGVIVNCGATIDHDCQVEDFGHLGVNASMAGGTFLSHGAWMRAGSVLGYGVKVKPGVIIDSGEVLRIHD